MSAPTPLDPQLGAALLSIARAAIEEAVGAPGMSAGSAAGLEDAPVDFNAPGASFVTLTKAGHLRGCIGSLEAYRPLIEDVSANAVAAATRDPRFLPVVPGELADLRIEISVLSPQRPLGARSREEALGILRPGVDGVVLEDGCHRATFLPQVWEGLPDPNDFLAHLARKAGLAPGHWGPGTRLLVYEIGAASEPDRETGAR
ncbi:AmmeMemoRadiSam system protein A [Actinomyces mediterranea]|uniref:AmmeMemoRadiSam system protein A n=1 Tax=Actinomyces mediterranea TaxID=1871028 RepID=UPI0009712F62|nr:AmmeMemoRadiSam system protein A [Actinomyces mediterranea]